MHAIAEKILRHVVVEIGSNPTTPITLDFLKNVINKFDSEYRDSDGHFPDKEIVLKKLESIYNVRVLGGAFLKGKDPNHKPWYKNYGKRVFWDSYKEYLTAYKNIPIDSVNNLIDKTTDEIMNYLEDPNREDSWDRRGLVIGSVQSGKTSHFIALINKAVDAGYKRIVVLSGLNNTLRKQTQSRVDDGFLGYDSYAASRVNDPNSLIRNFYKLGQIRKQNGCERFPVSATSSSLSGDFKISNNRNFNVYGDIESLYVVKKNKSILERLITHFKSDPRSAGGISNIPILLIDDEVDSGSVDTGEQIFDDDGNPDPDYEPKTINKLIRQLMKIHNKRCYVGYTATPFANIYIHDEAETEADGLDLFPKDFIYDLPVPENHFGLEKLFPSSIDPENKDDFPFIDFVTDNCKNPQDLGCDEGWIPPKHGSNHIPLFNERDEIPPSLKKAINYFILSCVARNYRSQVGDPKSMLIHVSRFIKVTDIVTKQVKNYIQEIIKELKDENSIEYNLKIEELRKIWDQDFWKKLKDQNIIKQEISFDHLLNEKNNGIKFVISQIEKNIKRISGPSEDELDYDEYYKNYGIGLTTIIVGGNKLSRGVTLEGLTTSYYLRPARMYDTLMQMGRWFGYREGYDDLCRLFTNRDIAEWFKDICERTEEFRETIRYMEKAKLTPKEFGLRIKSHEILQITSNTKMRHAERQKIHFSQSFGQSVAWDRSEEKIKSNFLTVEKLIASIGKPSNNNGILNNELLGINYKNCYIWKDIKSQIILDFLRKFTVHQSVIRQPIYYADYINKLNLHNELTNWTVVLFGNGSSEIKIKILDKYKIELILRKPSETLDKTRYSVGTVTAPKDQGLDLSDDEIKKAEQEGLQYRFVRNEKKGLILLYPILPIIELDNYNKINPYNEKKIAPEEKLRIYKEIGIDNARPVFSMGISFPTTKLDAKNIEIDFDYFVNSTYYRQMYDLNNG